MTEYVTRAGIETDPQLAAFIDTEVLGPLGRAPATIAASLIGVVRTRSGWLFCRPRVTLKAPP